MKLGFAACDVMRCMINGCSVDDDDSFLGLMAGYFAFSSGDSDGYGVQKVQQITPFKKE